jgi:hypothetical protein
MSYEYSEDGLVENATQQVLEDLGWEVKSAWKKESFGPDGLLGRDNKSEVIPLFSASVFHSCFLWQLFKGSILL